MGPGCSSAVLTTISSKKKIIARKIFASCFLMDRRKRHSLRMLASAMLFRSLITRTFLITITQRAARGPAPESAIKTSGQLTTVNIGCWWPLLTTGHWPLLAGAGSARGSLQRPDNSIPSNLVSHSLLISNVALFFIFIFAVSKLCKHQTRVWTAGLLANSSF